MDANFIPIVAIGGGIAAGVIIACFAMYFDHKKQMLRNQERMAAIEKGIPLPDLSREKDECGSRSGSRSLSQGIRLLFIGGGLALALWVTLGPKLAIWGAFVAIIGLGHLVYWFLVERSETGSAS
jgi:Flp pilus assembly protein TadB